MWPKVADFLVSQIADFYAFFKLLFESTTKKILNILMFPYLMEEPYLINSISARREKVG